MQYPYIFPRNTVQYLYSTILYLYNTFLSLFLIFIFVVVKTKSPNVQLKVKNLEFHEKPSHEIKTVENQTLTCSAYGNTGKMSGKWSSVDGKTVDYISYTDGNIFTMKANVKKTGTYICFIKSRKKEIHTVTKVNMFTSMFICFIPIHIEVTIEILMTDIAKLK